MSFLKKSITKQIQKETPLPGNPKEMEEDGFILIGETEEEMKALTPDKRNPNSDLPPNYETKPTRRDLVNARVSMERELTSCSRPREMSQTQYGSQEIPARSRSTHQTPCNQREDNKINAQISQRSPLFDVPFKLDDSVACALSHGHLNIDIGDELSWTTSQYDYDFSMERSVMQQSDV